ncbi:zinc-binding dehydrogenase [Enhygromyxa salina]|uniref:Zinc-binding dehydrogenase n=1 Tax=Enhygromyxa salina TaxID=215803 RepID=A0A2S9YN25_9BACT|nr:zinc-binding dehydrogenase [Enhygromyxa salina]PRQ06481.1 Zinc-binding dehydrogenase [Enhygromyxa salina]
MTEQQTSPRGECDAWVLHAGKTRNDGPTSLVRAALPVVAPGPGEVLVAPLFGSWEGNMGHALAREPVDVARLRREKAIVIGNAGVVRVLELGPGVEQLAVGDLAMTFPSGLQDEVGYMVKARGFDAPHQPGLLATRVTMQVDQLIRIPPDSRLTPTQWAAFSVRFVTAWSNWELAKAVFRLQMNEADRPVIRAWGWGGGTTLAELDLARREGCEVVMISGSERNLAVIERASIQPLDRRRFPGLLYDAERAEADAEYRRAHGKATREFLATVRELTHDCGVDIFLDYVGEPVYALTLKALARQGVIATAGWKSPTQVSHSRAQECILRHQHIYTHYARRSQGLAAMAFAERTGWAPEVATKVYTFDEIPELARAYAEGDTHYFTCFSINQD